MNLAGLWGLPVLFLCENNLYAMGTALERSESQTVLTEKARSYGVPSEAVDGMDVLEVEQAARTAVESIRAGNGPYFLELRTYRFRAHSMFDPQLYRDKAEVEEWKLRDPVDFYMKRLRDQGWITDTDVEQIESEIKAELEDAIGFAEASPPEPVEDLGRFVYSEPPESTAQGAAHA